MQLQRAGGGVAAGAGVAVDAIAERADDAAAGAVEPVQHMRQQLRDGGLAVGAGDANDVHVPRWITVEAAGDGTDLGGQAGHANHRYAEAQGVAHDRALGVDQHRHRAAVDGLLQELGGVGVAATTGDEQVAGLDLTAVITDAGDLTVQLRRNQRDAVQQLAHRVRLADRLSRAGGGGGDAHCRPPCAT